MKIESEHCGGGVLFEKYRNCYRNIFNMLKSSTDGGMAERSKAPDLRVTASGSPL